MAKYREAKASIGYTIGNYCIKGIGFITVPIFARMLTTSDYGIYNTFLAYEAVLYIFISLALHASLKNANYKFEGQIDKYTSSITILPQIIALALLIITFIFRGLLSDILKIDEFCVLFLVIYSYCSGLLILYQSRIALDYNYKEYIGLSAFSVLCNVGISLFLIGFVFESKKYLGRVIGGTISYALMATYILYRLYRKATPQINTDYWKYGLKLSLPIIPHGLAQILLLQFDRIMINSIVGNAEAGLYSFAYTIYSLVQITANSLETVYSTWVFGKLKKDNDINSVQTIGTIFLIFIAGVVTGVMLLAPEFIRILGGTKYKESVECVLPILLAGFFAMGYGIPSVLEYYHEKTKYIMIGTSLAAVMNITLNAIFIPMYGYVAAAYTTLVSYIVYFTLHVIVAKKLSGFNIIYPRYLVASITIVLSAFVVAELLKDELIIRLLVFIGLLIIGVLMIAHIYGVEQIKGITAKLRNRIKGRH